MANMVRCAGTCGRMIARSTRSAPNPVCRPCRQSRWAGGSEAERYELTCEHCGAGFRRAHSFPRFCSRTCANRALHPAYRPAGTARVDRVRRDVAAPGLSAKRRSKLLARWKRQGRCCAYCPAPAATVDHVVPLVLGGTNWEGNLVPCCRRCNSSKSGLLLIQWRVGYSAKRSGGRISARLDDLISA